MIEVPSAQTKLKLQKNKNVTKIRSIRILKVRQGYSQLKKQSRSVRKDPKKKDYKSQREWKICRNHRPSNPRSRSHMGSQETEVASTTGPTQVCTQCVSYSFAYSWDISSYWVAVSSLNMKVFALFYCILFCSDQLTIVSYKPSPY